ncbi:MAG TPA: Fe-S cluster assembly ATPase SufC [Candidatus Babeliales bacterium]|nr:Fe-S cluster assembly ATPase SufC [Candidatus Babeliales bacterium]
MLIISGLQVSVDDTVILKGVDLTVNPGSIHAIMGPNGSGKSSLAYTLMGHPLYTVLQGSIQFCGQVLTELSVDKRAQAGIFLSFQQPYAVPGVTVFSLLKEAHRAVAGKDCSIKEFQDVLADALTSVGLAPSFADRAIHEGFSGGEKKRLEMAQMLILKPKLIILDEIDSGLDIDALKLVAACINRLKTEQPAMSVICITHYQRILDYVIPDSVHVMIDGVIARSGDAHLARSIEHAGYVGFK